MKRRSIVLTMALLTGRSLACGHASKWRLNRETSPRRRTISAFSGGLMRFLETLPCGIAMDDRVCDDDEASGTRSLFCALQKADREILGEYQHRNVALQEVRFAIQMPRAIGKPRWRFVRSGDSVCRTGLWTSTICRRRALRM
jgi:hypothetical protein